MKATSEFTFTKDEVIEMMTGRLADVLYGSVVVKATDIKAVQAGRAFVVTAELSEPESGDDDDYDL